MESGFATLQDFMYFTKSWAYILVVGVLIAMGLFWSFLSGREED